MPLFFLPEIYCFKANTVVKKPLNFIAIPTRMVKIIYNTVNYKNNIRLEVE